MRNTSFSSLIRATFFLLLLVLPLITYSQVSNVEAYKEKVYQEMVANGPTDLFSCSESGTKKIGPSERAKSQAISCATAFQGGYGTNCWDDTNTEPDPACAIPGVPSIDCNGGNYRIPIAITIFECFDWTGTNYLETEEGGFEPILNMDLNNKLVEVNELFANANIEFYEVNRQRVQDCDLYDFYQNADPSTGFNDGNDDLVESVGFDIPNAINLYFVGGLSGDHDCCGFMAFAPYPPGRDYSVLRYGTAVIGSNLAHELGHYFGLPHTYAESIDFPVIDGDGVPTGALDNCDCLTEGDRICDTWPDPSFSHNCNHLGPAEACYINMTAGSFCEFDEFAYANHILESHPGASPNLVISPNSGTTFSSTSSTVLNQNIMSNNFIFGCTTTFSPCQYRKIHDVARSDCRNYLCNATASDYFQSTTRNNLNSSSYEICIGDDLPTFQAGRMVNRFDGSQYALDCFDWFAGEFDEQSEALLFNSSSFTPTADQINTAVAGTYEYWVAEVNALNDPPCKVKVSITIADNPGMGLTTTNSETIDACTESNLTINATGTSINNNADLIGWYFSDANPTETLTTGIAAQTAIQTAANSTIWNTTTGNIVQSNVNDPLTSLSNVSIDCNTLPAGDGTYFLTPFIAKGAVAQNCSTSSSSSSFNWNIAGGFTGGATVNLGPINDCSVAGLSVDDFSVTLNITDCETVGGDIGAKIFFNRGTELSINTPFDFIFDCTQDVITISGDDLRSLRSNYDPMVDQLQINFINTNFFRTNFQGTIDLSFNARIDVNYSGNNAQVIWDANNTPNIDTSNIDCFWGDPITVLCDCENSICPEIGELTGSTAICTGDNSAFLAVDDIQNIGNFNLEFVYFLDRQTDSSLYVNTPSGILGSGLVIEQVPYPTEAGTYYVYARLDPAPINNTCLPFQELVVEVIDLPSPPITSDILYCEGDSIISSVVGDNLLWYDTPMGGDGRDDPMFELAVLDTQSYWVSQTINACESPRAKLDLIRVERPDPPNIPDVNLCMGDESTEIVEGIPNLLWYTTETSTIGSLEAPTINTAIAGTMTFWVSRTITCESERVPVVVTVNAFPVNPVVEDLFYCLNTTVEPLSANGGNLRWYDSFADLVGTDVAPTPRTDSIGVFSYMVSQTVNGCESGRAIINVAVNTEAPSPLVNNVSTCQGVPVTLDVQGTDLKWFESLSDSTSSDTIPIPIFDETGIQSFWVSQILGGCESERVEVQVIINDAPTSPITSTVRYCVDSEAIALTALGDSLVWYTSAMGGEGLASITPSTDTIGTQSYWVSQIVNGCESERSLINVIVSDNLEIEITSSQNPTICSGRDGSFAIGNLMANTIYQLSYTLNTEIVVDSFISDTIGGIEIASLGAGEYENIFVSGEGCSSNQLTVQLTDPNEEISAVLQSDITQLCNGSTANLSATITGGEAPYILVYNNGVEDSIISNYSSDSLLPISPTQTSFYTLVSIGDSNNCQGTVSNESVIIAVVDQPTAPITSALRYCQNDIASALTAIGDSLVWYTSATGDIGSMTIIPSTDSVGVQQFWVSQMINGCESDRAILEVTIDSIPQAPIVSDVNYFVNDTAVSLTAIGNQLLWYTDTSEAGSTTAPVPTTDMVGTQTFRVSQTINNCESERIPILVTIRERTITEVGVELILPTNGNNGSISFTGLLPDTSYVVSYTKDNIVVTDTITTNQDGTIIVEDLESGTYSDISITFNDETINLSDIDLPDAICDLMAVLSGTDTICSDEDATIAVTISNGTGPYQLTLSDGINNFEFPKYVNGNKLPFLVDSTTTYTVIQLIDSDSCSITDAVNPITIIVNTTSAPIVTPVTYCVGSEASPLMAEGTDLKWYTTAIGGTSLDTIIPSTDSVGVQQFWVSQTINGCESDRAILEVTTDPIPPAPIVSDINYFVNDTAGPLTAIGNQLLWYSSTSEASTTIAPVPTTDRVGTQTFRVSQTINNCESEQAFILVTTQERTLTEVEVEVILPTNENSGSIIFTGLLPDTSYVISYTRDSIVVVDSITTNQDGTISIEDLESGTFSDISITFNGETINLSDIDLPDAICDIMAVLSEVDTICSGEDAPLNVTISNGTGPYQLTLSDGTNNFEFSDYVNGTNLFFTLDSTTTYTVIQLIDSDSCSITDAVNPITIIVNTTSAPIVTPVTYCVGSEASPLMAEGTDLKWYTTAIGGTSMDTIIPSTDSVGVQQFWVSQTINGCESARAIALVSNNSSPLAPSVLDTTYFLNETAMPIMAFGSQLRWYATEVSSDGTSTAPIPNTSILGVQTYWVSQTIGDCESERVPVNVTVREQMVIDLGLIVPPTNITNGSIQLMGLLNNTTYTLIYEVSGNTITTAITTDEAGNYVITDLVAGNYSDIRVVLDGQSSNSLEVMLETVICNITATFSENDTICLGETSSISIVIENGSNPYDLTLTDGSSLLEFPSYISGTSISVMPNSTSIYTIVSLEDSTGCTLIGDDNIGEVIINVIDPAAPTTSNVTFCIGTELTPLSAIGNNLLWYTTANGGLGSPIPPIPNTDIVGTTTYWVSQEVNNCESDRAMIRVEVKAEIAPPNITSLTYCLGADAAPLNAEGNNLLWYTSSNQDLGNTMPPIPNTSEIGTTVYGVSQTIDGCESDLAMIEVTIDDERPSPPLVESVRYCQGETTLPYNVQGENLRWYVLPTGGTGTTYIPHPTSELPGRYHYWVSQSVNGCESELARITTTISETPVPEIGLVIPPSPCLKNGAIQLKKLVPNESYILSYTVNGNPVTPSIITATSTGTHIFTGLGAGLYTAIKVQSRNCQSVGLQQELIDNAFFSVEFTGTPSICEDEAGELVLNIEGGVAPYSLLITDIENTYSLSDYESGEPLTVRPTETTNYFLISIQDRNGCDVTIENEVVSITVLDCESMDGGSLQNTTIERVDFIPLDVEAQRSKTSKDFELYQNEPNPFSNQTTIGFSLPGDSPVELIVRDNTGRIIKRLKEYGAVGTNHILLDDLAGTKGLLYYQLITDFGTKSKKMLLVR